MLSAGGGSALRLAVARTPLLRTGGASLFTGAALESFPLVRADLLSDILNKVLTVKNMLKLTLIGSKAKLSLSKHNSDLSVIISYEKLCKPSL